MAQLSESLLMDRIDNLRDAFRVAHAARPSTIDAILILPNHLRYRKLPSVDFAVAKAKG